MTPILELKGISKSFHIPTTITILNDVGFSLRKGESLAITGHSGVGKSSLLNIIGGLEKPTLGNIYFQGKELKSLDPNVFRRKHVGFIFQAYNLLEDYTALDNVLIAAQIDRKSTKKGSAVYQRACNLLETVGLEDRFNHPVKLLSGGEKQRVAIARALCNNPDLILADELTGNLDEVTGKIVQNLLFKIVKEQGKTLIIVTHNHDLADLCDRKFELKNASLNPLYS